MHHDEKHLKSGPMEEAEENLAIAACPGCDLIIPVPRVPDGHYLACGRCGTPLSRRYRNSINRVLALSFAGLLLYLPAMLLPLMTLSSLGIKEDGNVIDTCIDFFRNGFYFVAIIVLCTAIIFPFLKLFLPFSLSFCLKINRRPHWLRKAFRLYIHLEEWGMVEVYLLGILVTLIKMSDMADIAYNAGFFCFIALVLLTMSTAVCLDNNLFWHHIAPPEENPDKPDLDRVTSLILDRHYSTTALEAGLMRCHECGQLIPRLKSSDSTNGCPRCGSSVHSRISGSITKTWALVITSTILFFPANMLPIMQVDFLGIPDRSTILDGILYFFEEGSFGIGLIILVASILVPLFKIVGLIIILLSIRSGRRRFLRQKTTMFRFIEFIGRWSMLDIFVVSLLSVLVNFGFLTSIHTAPGATYFCIVVVMTMTAAIMFDPRLLWDACDPLGHGTGKKRG